MDIAGAKALEERLGPKGTDESLPPGETADVPADAPPVYHWTGKTPSQRRVADADEDAAGDGTALFRRLAMSFR
jgi:hypothetical protein